MTESLHEKIYNELLHIILRPFTPPITRNIYMAYRKQLNYFPLLKAFVQYIEKFIHIVSVG